MQRRVFNKRSSRGMSLVEMIVVLAIMSVVIMATMSMYVPAQRATVVQTQVTDIQANLRLAMNRLSQDLLTAGFLVQGQPIVFDSGVAGDPLDFTIRTRLIGEGFGRVSSAGASGAGADVRLNLTSTDMAAQFPVNSLVRLIEPVTSTECNEALYDDDKRVYQVVSSTVDNNGTAGDPSDDFAVIEIDDLNDNLAVTDVNPETVVVRVVSNLMPPVQTIRYQFADSNGDGTRDTLLRIVNGNTQFMARELSSVSFGYVPNDDGDKIRRVNITLGGQTRAIVAGDPISGAKTRTLQSAVTLRNVF